MVYSLTDKLTFDKPPQIEISGKVLTIDNSAQTVLKLMDIVQTEGELAGATSAFDLLFSNKDRKIIDGLKLSMKDYVTLAEVALDLALGNDPDAKRSE